MIKLSKLIRDTEPATAIATEDIVQALQSVTEELVGTGVVVEVDAAK